VSGILAVVTCGLFLSRRSPALFSPTVRLQVYAVWGAVVFILNGIVFTMVGLQLPMMLAAMPRWTTGSLLRDAAWFSALVAGLRLAWAFPGARLAHVIRRRLLHHRDPQPRAPEIVVIAWSGMRGAIALAAAASLPAALPQRSRIVFMTFAAVVATLVGQGLTLAPLARALGLTGAAADDSELDAAHRAAIEAAMAHLESIRGRDDPAFAGVYDDLAQHYRERLGALSGADPADRSGDDVSLHDRHRELSSELAGVERATVLRLRDEGRIGDETLREVEHDLDLREARFE
jgi:CPA1 family monovalent cation:H+ antiporter